MPDDAETAAEEPHMRKHDVPVGWARTTSRVLAAPRSASEHAGGFLPSCGSQWLRLAYDADQGDAGGTTACPKTVFKDSSTALFWQLSARASDNQSCLCENIERLLKRRQVVERSICHKASGANAVVPSDVVAYHASIPCTKRQLPVTSSRRMHAMADHEEQSPLHGAGAAAGGREAAVQAMLGRAYEAGANAPQIPFSGEVYRGVPEAYWPTAFDWTSGGRRPGGSGGRYGAVGDPLVYTSPTAAEAVGEASVYQGMANRTLIRSQFDAPGGRGGLADASGSLPFDESALTARRGAGESPMLYRIMGENPYSMPQQLGAGAMDAGASAVRVPSATGGAQIDLVPRNLDPTQVRPLGRTPFDAHGVPGAEVPVAPGQIAAVPPDASTGGSGPREMAAGGAGRASSARFGAAAGAGVALASDLYRRFVQGEDIGAGEIVGETALGAGTGASAGVAADAIGARFAPTLGARGGAIAGGGLVEAALSGIMSTWNNAGAFERGEETASQATANVAVDTGIGLASGASGAALGAAIGSIIPGAGTAIGAGLGFLGGMAGSYLVHLLADGSGFTEWAKHGLGSALSTIERPLGAIWHGVSGATHAIGDAASAVGHGISSAASSVWHWITD